MSHFTVMVIDTKGHSDSVEDQLEPYDENIVMDEYCTGEVPKEDFDKFKNYYTAKDAPDYSKSKVDGNYPTRDISANKSLSDEELYAKFGEDWNGGRWRFENGVWNDYSTYNPKSKWDWYSIGGRWDGFLLDNEGKKVNFGAKGEIDWTSMMGEGAIRNEKRWDEVAKFMGVDENGKIVQPPFSWAECREKFNDNMEKVREFYHNQEVVQKFAKMPDKGFFEDIEKYNKTREEFARTGANNNVATYAVLKDGEWIAKGEMGWFGMSSESNEEAQQWSDDFYKVFIEPLDDNAFITIVDCHI